MSHIIHMPVWLLIVLALPALAVVFRIGVAADRYFAVRRLAATYWELHNDVQDQNLLSAKELKVKLEALEARLAGRS